MIDYPRFKIETHRTLNLNTFSLLNYAGCVIAQIRSQTYGDFRPTDVQCVNMLLQLVPDGNNVAIKPEIDDR